MCEIKPGPRCATDTCADAMAAGALYRETHPSGPGLDPLANASSSFVSDPYGPNVHPLEGPPAAARGRDGDPYTTTLADGTVMTHHPQPPVTLGGREFTVETTTWSHEGRTSTNTVLTGPRGAQFFLRPFLGDDTGARQVIAYKSGQPLRIQGNEVRVVQIGDILEQQHRSVRRIQ